jgi:hypothetical protein
MKIRKTLRRWLGIAEPPTPGEFNNVVLGHVTFLLSGEVTSEEQARYFDTLGLDTDKVAEKFWEDVSFRAKIEAANWVKSEEFLDHLATRLRNKQL